MNVENLSRYRLEELEQLLDATLIPVKPRSEFISKLKLQIGSKVADAPTISRSSDKQTILLALVSAVGSSMVVITSLRAFLSLIGLISVFHLLKQHSVNRSLSSNHTATG